ncbi:hypothetical protein HYS03_00435 [Candidatus Woesebacteria bacterium]|nr:hypothetical protein [Candidatus Woesebacteria bacterium]
MNPNGEPPEPTRPRGFNPMHRDTERHEGVIPPSEMTFKEARRDYERLKERFGDLTDQERQRFDQVDDRMNQLLNIAERHGLMEEVEERSKAFEQRADRLKKNEGASDFDSQKAKFLERVEDEILEANLGGFKFDYSDVSEDDMAVLDGVKEYRYAKNLGRIRTEIGLSGELPLSIEKQREMARRLLDRIEANDINTYDVTNQSDNDRLKDLLTNRDLEPKVKAEILARLRLQDCYILVKAALKEGGNDRDKKIPGGLFKRAQTELSSKGRVLEGSDFDTLRDEIPGINIKEAFGRIQDAALRKEIFQKSISEDQEERVYRRIVRDMGGGEAANKAVQLARRLAWATLEVSVWNSELAGVDPLAESINLQKYREGRGIGRDRGPEVTVDKVVGFGSSFFRMARTVRGPLTDRGARLGNDSQKLDLGVMNFMNLGREEYGNYLSTTLPRILEAHDMFLQSDWEPDMFKRDRVESWFGIFDTVDPDRSLKLRYYFIEGALVSTFRSAAIAADLGWSRWKYNNEVVSNIVKPKKKKKENVSFLVYFLTPGELKEIGAKRGITTLFGRLDRVDALTGAGRGGGGGGKKRK